MTKQKLNFNNYFQTDLGGNKTYSPSTIASIIRSLLEPVAKNNAIGIVFTHFKNLEGIDSIIKRLEYSKNVTLRTFSDFEFSKFDVEEIGFVVLTTKRYNAAFIFKEVQKNKYEIYLKMNSKLVGNVYETLKSIFLIDYDEQFYEYRPERRENDMLNEAINNITARFEEAIEENECNARIQENYKTVNETNNVLRNEIYQNTRQVAHEIKNQLSILDIYTRIFEKKTGDTEITEPIKKSIALIRSQLNQFKNIDVINLQERDIRPILMDVIKTYSNLLKEKNNKIIFIDEMTGVETNAFIDEEKFGMVVSNIIKNAHDATENDEIIVKLVQINETIKISFINHGPMIKPINKEKIFERGYTTKSDGWGVGLAVCKKFIGSQFGTLDLEKSDDKETIFTLSLPLVDIR